MTEIHYFSFKFNPRFQYFFNSFSLFKAFFNLHHPSDTENIKIFERIKLTMFLFISKLKIRYPNYKRMVMIGSTIAIVSILGYLMYDTLWKWAHNPMLYFAACVVGYSIVCGGAVFSWIHQVPFMTVDRNGNGQWFASGGAREQLGAEALVMALVVGGGSMGWVLVGGLLPSLNRPRIVLLLAFCITICLMLLARVFFMWKHPYYPY